LVAEAALVVLAMLDLSHPPIPGYLQVLDWFGVQVLVAAQL